MPIDSNTEQVLRQTVAATANLSGVVAITLGGSTTTGLDDSASDLDLHVYWRAPLAPAAERAAQLAKVADEGTVETNILAWGLEDHMQMEGRPVELIYVSLQELLTEIEQAYGAGLGSEGYTTTRLFYVANGWALHDPSGELGGIRARLLVAYPEPTRRRLLGDHPELLRIYLDHLRKAQARGDLLFVQHRRYTVQMVFFNLLFALNRRYHPGEKRLLTHAERCQLRPDDLGTRWLHTTRMAADDPALAEILGELIEDLCTLIEANA